MSLVTRICTGLMVSTLSFSVHAANNQQPQQPNPPEAPQEQTIDVANTPEVIQSLYVSNAAEIKAAELVAQKSSDEDLIKYAEELSKDHSWFNKLLELIANVKSVSLNSEELSEKVQKIAAEKDEAYNMLSQVPDAEFRKVFVEGSIAEHQKTLELFSAIEAGSSDDAVKLSISVFRQFVEKHLADAQKLQAGGQIPPDDGSTSN